MSSEKPPTYVSGQVFFLLQKNSNCFSSPMTALGTYSWVKMTVSDGRQEITSQKIYKGKVKTK